MQKFSAFYSLIFFSSLFFSCSLVPASAPDNLRHDGGPADGEISYSIPLDQLQIIYLRPAHKAKKSKSAYPENSEHKEEEKFFEMPAFELYSSIDFGPNYMPDYAPFTQQELAALNIQSTKPVRQSLGAQDCAVHALANALAINTALANMAHPESAAQAARSLENRAQKQAFDIKKLVNTESHDLYYAQIETACDHNTYNLSSDAIQQALGTLKAHDKNQVNQDIFTNIFIIDNVAELPLLEQIQQAVIQLPAQPDNDPRGAIHFICNTRPYYGDYRKYQEGKHWVTLSLIKQKHGFSFYFSDSNYGRIPETLHPLIRILAERYHIIAPNQNPQYQPPQDQPSVLVSLIKWLIGW